MCYNIAIRSRRLHGKGPNRQPVHLHPQQESLGIQAQLDMLQNLSYLYIYETVITILLYDSSIIMINSCNSQ